MADNRLAKIARNEKPNISGLQNVDAKAGHQDLIRNAFTD